MEQNENPQVENQPVEQNPQPQPVPGRITPPMPPKPKEKKPNIGLKILLIAGLSLGMLIPRIFIGLLIDGRERAAKSSSNEVFASWGGEQTINGPVLYIPQKKNVKKTEIKSEDNTLVAEVKDVDADEEETGAIYIVPEDYNFSGKLSSEKLHRGIYDVVVYKTTADLKGSFEMPEDLNDINWDNYNLTNSKLYVDFGRKPNPNLTDKISINIGDTTYAMKYNSKLVAMACNYDATSFVKEGKKLDFSTQISMKGASSFSVVPVGNTSTIHMESDYPSPSFKGACLPDTREVTSDGFTADWKVVRNIPLDFSSKPTMTKYYDYEDLREVYYYDDETTNNINGIHVEMNMPVDQYTQNDRAIKYSFLIVVLTFITVFVVENRKRTPIHWVQYLLIGFAIMVFYTLLLSFSEYLTFCWSYLIASAMTIGLITAYMAGILKVHKTAYLVGAILAFLYAFIYVLLSLETMSLLVGSIGLFVILAVIMFASRKINWQGNDKQ